MHRDEQILAVGIAEAARRLGLSPRTVAALIARRELPSKKIGRRRIIALNALEAFVDRQPFTPAVTRVKKTVSTKGVRR
jgi:excisionase family DNA binding protein